MNELASSDFDMTRENVKVAAGCGQRRPFGRSSLGERKVMNRTEDGLELEHDYFWKIEEGLRVMKSELMISWSGSDEDHFVCAS